MSFEERFQRIVEVYNDKQRLDEIEQLKQRLSGQTIALFGAAWIGDFVYERLMSWGIVPICFIDNYATGCTPNGHGPILRPAEVKEKYPDCTVILSLDRAKEIVYNQLLEMGFPAEKIIKETKHLINVMEMEQIKEHIDGYKWAYDFFEDSVSKDIVMERIACYLYGEEVQKSECPQYFEKDLFQFTEQEVFVDGGFFTGDTAEEFIRQVNGAYRKIYGFEPDEYVREKVSETLLGEKLEIVPKGLYSYDGEVKFATTGGTSQASGGNVITSTEDENVENVISIPVTSIDAFFADKEEALQPTFVKMDIEGSEKEALLGAEKTIRKYKPKLAICVYHKPEDIYELTKLIYSFNPQYKFAVRHYAHYFWETVLFAYE